jgi:antitoxin component of MazEF toxin-antitoxin module
MPLIRKVVRIGNSKAVFLPKTWLEYYESMLGREVKLVVMEVDEKIEIKPYVKVGSPWGKRLMEGGKHG